MSRFEYLKSLGFIQEHSSPGTNEMSLTIGKNVVIYVSDSDGDASEHAINTAKQLILGVQTFGAKGDDFVGGCEVEIPND